CLDHRDPNLILIWSLPCGHTIKQLIRCLIYPFNETPVHAASPVADPGGLRSSGVIMEHLQTQGISLPRLELGTFRMQGDTCRAAVESAIALGYRLSTPRKCMATKPPSAP